MPWIEPRRSVGHSHVMSPAERAPRASLAVLQGLTLKAGRRLRSYGMMAGRMGLHLKLTNGRHWEKGCRFQETQDSFFFSRLLNELWEERPTHQVPVLRGGVILGDLVEMENATLSLFASDHSRQISLNKALDQIAARFGNGAVSIGGAHGSQNATPPKVAFQHVPDLDIEL